MFPANEEAAVRANFSTPGEGNHVPAARRGGEMAGNQDCRRPADAGVEPGGPPGIRDLRQALVGGGLPQTVPRQEELNPRLAAFASLGEYEPVTFTCCPGGLVFRPGRGERFARGGGDSGGEHRGPLGPQHARAAELLNVFSYHEALRARAGESLDLARGRNQRFWITVKTPDEAASGSTRAR